MISQWLWLLVLSTLPLIESRLAIPLGIFKFGFDPWLTALVTVIGNALSIALVLKLLPPMTKFFRARWKWLDHKLEDLFHRTRKEHSHKIKIWGDVFLFLFVSVPLPGSGGWTAALVAFVFGFPFRRSVWLISAGLAMAAILVVLASLGGQEIFNVFNPIDPQKSVEIFNEFVEGVTP